MRVTLAQEMVLTVSEGEVCRIRLSSPSTKNALDEAMTQAVLASLRRARGRVILLESEGPVFASGDAVVSEALLELLSCGEWLERPLVAAVQGPAAGAGVALIANAHVVIAAQGASFALTEIRGGAWPEAGWRALTRALGVRRARALALTGRVFSAGEALQWGLVHELAPAFELEDRAAETAAHLAAMDAVALRGVLRGE